MDDRELFKKVLSFLQQTIAYSNEEMARLDELKKLVRERLSQQEQTRSEKLLEAGYTRRSKGWSKDEPKPVAWMYVNKDEECEQIEYGEPLDDPSVTLLYTAPPKKEWVSLTDEEIRFLRKRFLSHDEFAAAIEAKLKEKNT